MIKYCFKKLVCGVLISTFFLLNVPSGFAQDVVTSDDFSGGASVFTFRESRKAKQKKAAVKSGFVASRSVSQRKKSRSKVKTQLVAKNKPRPRSKSIEPTAVAKTAPKTAAAKLKASNDFAGVGETQLDRNETDEAIASKCVDAESRIKRTLSAARNFILPARRNCEG